ncbi:MAG: DnaJ domain-containing protein [Magnetococcales bacterium]|nr:DnaJ domain-containing protein [Magnetococcales bacterium]MBF0632107.1 DnaJ domain-containing protein [Magnetococcales bacterium]
MNTKSPLCPDPLKEQLLDRLAAILSLHPMGIKEHALYRILKQERIDPFAQSNLSDHLELFQIHFLLFHLLYLLKARRMQNREGDMEIHCLKIRLKPWPHPLSEGMVTPFDPLQDYYLDLTHLEKTTRTEVETMIDSFWRQWGRYERRGAALELFGLPGEADEGAIRARYRQLAKKHHPDTGGDPIEFRKVAEAAEILMKKY